VGTQPRGTPAFSAKANGQIKGVGNADNGMRIGCMKQNPKLLVGTVWGSKIVWQVALDIPDLYGTNFVFEVVADDNVGLGEGFVSPINGSKMVLIPAGGSFEMGDHFNEGEASERPVRTVELDAFYMDDSEVTVGQFKQFVQASGYTTNGTIWLYIHRWMIILK